MGPSSKNGVKVLTVKTHDFDKDGKKVHYKIISCPETVKSERYKRNSFKFNFGFVLRWDDDEHDDDDENQINDDQEMSYFKYDFFSLLPD